MSFSMWRCRYRAKGGVTKGCQCIACCHIRAYRKQWKRDQVALGTRCGKRIRKRSKTKAAIAKFQAWVRSQDPVALAMYRQLWQMHYRDEKRQQSGVVPEVNMPKVGPAAEVWR